MRWIRVSPQYPLSLGTESERASHSVVLTFVVDEVKQLIFFEGSAQAGAILLQGHGRFVTDCWVVAQAD